MNLSVSELQSLNCYAGSKKIAQVHLVVFDKTKGSVLSLIVKNKDEFWLINHSQIVDISKERLQIEKQKSLTPIPPNSLADKALRAQHHIIGLPVVTESGQFFGTVSDLNLVWPPGAIWQMVVLVNDGERLLAKNQILQITDTEVVIIEDVINPKFKWQAEIGQTADATN